jgi:hypothetical protein
MNETIYKLTAPVCMKHHRFGDDKPFPDRITLECGCTLIRCKKKMGRKK